MSGGIRPCPASLRSTRAEVNGTPAPNHFELHRAAAEVGARARATSARGRRSSTTASCSRRGARRTRTPPAVACSVPHATIALPESLAIAGLRVGGACERDAVGRPSRLSREVLRVQVVLRSSASTIHREYAAGAVGDVARRSAPGNALHRDVPLRGPLRDARGVDALRARRRPRRGASSVHATSATLFAVMVATADTRAADAVSGSGDAAMFQRRRARDYGISPEAARRTPSSCSARHVIAVRSGDQFKPAPFLPLPRSRSGGALRSRAASTIGEQPASTQKHRCRPARHEARAQCLR